MLDALVNGKDRDVPRARQAAGVVNPLEIVEDALIAVRRSENAIDEIRTGKVQQILGNGLALVLEEGVGLVTEERNDIIDHRVKRVA
jgi:hypothetical protein